MRRFAIVAVLVSLVAGCGRSAPGSSPGPAGTATLEVAGASYAVRDVVLQFQAGEDPWFSITGKPADDPGQDCVPGLAGGLDLYGDLPSSVKKPIDLLGERLTVDFTGDGDEANFCFVGMGGLAGAESAWVTIDSVSGDRASFTLSGSFTIYDQQGGEVVQAATAKGTARIEEGR